MTDVRCVDPMSGVRGTLLSAVNRGQGYGPQRVHQQGVAQTQTQSRVRVLADLPNTLNANP